MLMNNTKSVLIYEDFTVMMYLYIIKYEYNMKFIAKAFE